MGWQPIETAPKGGPKLIQGPKGVRKIHVSPRILTFTSAGDLTITYWVPEGERWSMFSSKTPPTHWWDFGNGQAMPELPK